MSTVMLTPTSLEVTSVNSLGEHGLDGVVETHVVIIHQLACVETFVEAVGQGCVRIKRRNRHTVGKMSRSGSKGDDGSGDVADGQLGCPAVVNDHDSPQAILGVAPPLQDDFAIKGDFTTCFVKEYLAAHVAQDGNREEIVDKAGESMS
jgi:hypothetical protein